MLEFPRIFAITLSVLIIFTLTDICFAETRYALVIGNGDYSVGKLTSPPLDADAMEKKLTQLNYKVTTRINLNYDQFKKEVRKFAELLNKDGTTGFFYYSGHGMQGNNGKNYMIPIDADISNNHDLEEYGIGLDTLMNRMASGNSNPNIIVLDACRNNPFEKSFKNVSAGLAEIKRRPPGTLIAFAAAPGRVAKQSRNQLSPYTAELLNQLNRTNVPLIPLFQAVADGVWKATDGDQEPDVQFSPNLRELILNGVQTSIRNSNNTLKPTNVDQKDTIASLDSAKSLEFEEDRRKAEQGNAIAQHKLGFMYRNGKGVHQDDVKAVEWYRKAAAQGYAAAQSDLGFMYLNGKGVPKDNAKAAEWYRKAAAQGDVAAQKMLDTAFETSAAQSKNTESKTKYWYYCRNPEGYYPYIRKCPDNNWLKIPPQNLDGQSGATSSYGLPLPPPGIPPPSPFEPIYIPSPPPPRS